MTEGRRAGALVRPRIAVCIPARNEASTIGAVVAPVAHLRERGVVHEVVVVDDGSTDETARLAASRGAVVVPSIGGPGKGEAMATAVAATGSEILVFLDADVTNLTGRFVTGLVAPLLAEPGVQLVKAAYRRSLHGRAGEGGRVTELLARPLLRRFFAELSGVGQPLAGEWAVRRSTLDDLVLADGYGVEIGLLIDVYLSHGRNAIAEVDLGERIHRNRPLRQLRAHSDDVLEAVLERVAVATLAPPA